MLIRQYTFFQTQIIVSLKHRPSVDAQSSLNCVLTSCLHTSSFAAYKSAKAAPLSPRFRFAHSDSVMDWFTWLSKTGLDPSLVYEYGLAFSNNELERDDISYFNHEFLQSMGISIAKHRLEILKLAKKDKRPTGFSRPRPISRLLGAIKRTKRYIKKCVNSLVHHQEYSSAIVVVPPRPSGYKWRGAMLKRNRKLTVAKPHSKQTRLLLTNGSASVDHSPVVYAVTKEGKLDAEDDDDGYWSNGVEEIRWDTMFQDLKPT